MMASSSDASWLMTSIASVLALPDIPPELRRRGLRALAELQDAGAGAETPDVWQVELELFEWALERARLRRLRERLRAAAPGFNVNLVTLDNLSDFEAYILRRSI